jgi:acetyl-CoA decarbonylase/synthase complex subunit gamma
VDPGLYALGNPDDLSEVLVTANYKMSFDRLRGALEGRDVWILVLDTSGVNVWCAAGKGTFGTDELVRRIESSGLDRIVSHREVILPQLSGPGVAAHDVKKRVSFRAVYGPIRTEDVKAFLDAGKKATPEMRRKTFTIGERTALIPVELVVAFKWCLLISAVFFFAAGLGGPEGYWEKALNQGLFAALAIFTALMAGAAFTPILLPWIPGRPFSLKGMIMGIIAAGALAIIRIDDIVTLPGLLEIIAWFLIVPALAAFLSMNFTGASTYTSLSGVRKEMKWAVPFQIAGGATGVCIWLASRFIA